MKHFKLSASKVKDSISPYDFYFREQNLHRLGTKKGQWAVAGICPFHVDSSAGSFKVNLESGGFICFSCGMKGGDIISFVEKKYGLSFSEALKMLANEWRVS
jgi:DNA primase